MSLKNALNNSLKFHNLIIANKTENIYKFLEALHLPETNTMSSIYYVT